MEGSFSDKKRNRMFVLGAGSFGLILLASLAYSQLAYDSYAQASTRTRLLQARMDDFLTVRGKVNGVVEALTDRSTTFANPTLAIDQRVWNLQMAWEDFREGTKNPWSGALFLTPSPSALDNAIDQFALSTLRNSIALRQGNSTQTALQITAGLDPHLAAMQREIADSITTATAERDSAMAGIAYGRSIAYGSFFALATLLAGWILFYGMRGFKEWMGRAPDATIASPHR
jgi:hypothetical protein